MRKTCETCDFWVQIEEKSRGLCHRYPPTVCIHLVPEQKPNIVANQQKITFIPRGDCGLPLVNKDEFCGEHHAG